jgi:ATP-dependent DNA helicase RecG
MTLKSPVGELKGVGDALMQKFAVLGLSTVADLLDYYPRRYEDYSQVTPLNKLRPGMVTIEAVIKQAKGRYVRRGMHITEAVASDKTGSIRLVWFNQAYRAESLKSNQPYFISGQYELSRQRFVIINPSVERVSDFPVNTARILAVYRETKGLTSRQIRLAMQQVLPLAKKLPETLPDWLLSEHKLMSRGAALAALHAPVSAQELAEATRRLGFEEVFCLSLASLLNKRENQAEEALAVKFDVKLAKDFVHHVPFTLTDGQRSSAWQIYKDMELSKPMNRLIEGDVGSGKTAVATMAALMVLAANKQVALMAPTELLARQHAETIYKLLEPLKLQDKVVLLVGSLSPAQKAKAHKAIKSGQAGFLIGTHALIQDQVDMHDLALIIIDEQHRFGVEQRKRLMAKAGHMPHVLSLTATPIPRSLALTLYGEMDISVLAEKPGGRLPVITEIVSPNSRAQLYKKIDQKLATGKQMFVVCPLITTSTMLEASAAEVVYDQLSKHEFKHRRVGLLHGKQKAVEKIAVMEQFVRHELDILVSTTVIEVGVDVPNASIMLVENAERFGLAQLHQLRGRVGRDQDQGHCYLMLGDSQPPSRRLRALTSSNDGFKLAELDLTLRGPGAVYGIAQHGALDMRLAPITDTRLIVQARKAAEQFIDKDEDLLHYKQLHKIVDRLRSVTNLN